MASCGPELEAAALGAPSHPDFIGKWTLTTAAGNAVYADPKTGALIVGTPPAPAQARFNAYGAATACRLQAAGGAYVTASAGLTFAATGTRDTAALFELDVNAAAVAVSWRDGNGATHGWLDSAGPLMAGSGAGARFEQTIVTRALPGLSGALGADLSWVYLADADLSGLLALPQADLTGADLSHANLRALTLTDATLSGANLGGATLTDADLTGARLDRANLAGAKLHRAMLNRIQAQAVVLNGASARDVMLMDAQLSGAQLIGTDLSGAQATVVNVDLSGADLSGATFTQASVHGLNLIGADLSRAKLGNQAKSRTIVLSDAKLDAHTNLTGAQLQYVDMHGLDLSKVRLAHADLTGAKLDGATLTDADLSYADLTRATLTGGIAMSGADLSNATLTGANLAGAQLGAIAVLFRVVDDASGQRDYGLLLHALETDDQGTVVQVCADYHHKLTLRSINASTSAPDRVWTLDAADGTYTVRRETIAQTDALVVYTPTVPAVLVNAFMKDAVLTSANLYGVNAAGAQLYGDQALLDGDAILEGADFADANLSTIDLTRAELYGASFAYATLVDARLDGAQLKPDAGRGAQASFANANLQGASFAGAALDHAILTDAAIAVDAGKTGACGVWLFSSADREVGAELTAAVKRFSIPATLANQLTQGTVTAPIIAAFQKKGVQLASTARVAVEAQGPLWTITDGATTYRIFRACEDLTPALGVSTGTGFVPAFTIPLWLESELAGSGPVGDEVRDAFRKAGHTLGTTAQLDAGTMPIDWRITDAQSPGFDVWLGLDAKGALVIAVRPGMPRVLALFQGHSLPLRRATVAALRGGWTVDNDSDDPFNATTNYVQCAVARRPDGPGVDVYGSALRVQRVGADGQVVYDNIQISRTKLDQADLQPTTVCPNSESARVNGEDRRPFAQWLRARALPKPPFCVPSADGLFICPPPGRV